MKEFPSKIALTHDLQQDPTHALPLGFFSDRALQAGLKELRSDGWPTRERSLAVLGDPLFRAEAQERKGDPADDDLAPRRRAHDDVLDDAGRRRRRRRRRERGAAGVAHPRARGHGRAAGCRREGRHGPGALALPQRGRRTDRTGPAHPRARDDERRGGTLHPAVARPGRCAADIDFTPLSGDEAADWLRRHSLEDGRGEARTLASLYAQLEGREPTLATFGAEPT